MRGTRGISLAAVASAIVLAACRGAPLAAATGAPTAPMTHRADVDRPRAAGTVGTGRFGPARPGGPVAAEGRLGAPQLAPDVVQQLAAERRRRDPSASTPRSRAPTGLDRATQDAAMFAGTGHPGRNAVAPGVCIPVKPLVELIMRAVRRN
jgi:hypothetical protein